MSDSFSADSENDKGREQRAAAIRLSATDLAILAAFCRPYVEGQRFPSPAPNNRIIDELADDGIFLDLDTLRTHLRNLYAKFGLGEGLTPGEKRVRLVECVYDQGLIPGWNDSTPRDPSPTLSNCAQPDEESAISGLRSTITGLLRSARERPWLAVGAAAALIGLVAVAIAKPWSTDAGSGDQSIIPPDAIRGATGQVTYCVGKDVVISKDGQRHQHEQAVKDFNSTSSPELRARLHEFPEDARQQYERFSRDQRERAGVCDVFYSDVTWTADFAHNKWLLDLTPYFKRRLASFVDGMQDAAVFETKMYGVPKQADAGLLYYRTDHVKNVPRTWQELYRQAATQPTRRLRYQGRDSEALTVNFLELAYAAGADEIVTTDHRANIDQVPTYLALEFMVEGIRSHAAPNAVVNQKEEQSLRAFGRGKADFMRNWPYVYTALQDRAKYPDVVGHVGVASLPTWNGSATTVLGGHVLVVSAFSKNPAGALKLVEYLSSKKIVKRDAIHFSLAPTITELWADREVRAKLPAFDDLRQAVFNARSRPITANYNAVSEAISENVNRALRREITPAEALDDANAAMQQALDDAYGSEP